MSTWLLVTFITVAWILYPVAGALHVDLKIRQGRVPEDAGFSFLPELLVFPILFLVVAKGIDWFINPWGSYFITVLSLLCFAMHCNAILVIKRGAKRLEK